MFTCRCHLRVLSLFITTFHCLWVAPVLLLYYVTHPFANPIKRRDAVPKCLTDGKHGEHKYARVNGIKLHYVEKGDNMKPLMIFLHGFPEFWYSWRYQLAEFSKDYWCVALDMRGYGDSEKPQGIKSYEINNIVNDVKELVQYLGRERFTLVGHDWGAVVVWKFVDTCGKMLDNFITISAASIETMGSLVMTEWWQFKHSWYVFFFQAPYLAELLMRMKDLEMFEVMFKKNEKLLDAEEAIEAFKYVYSKNGALTPPINYYRANMSRAYEKLTVGSDVPKGLYILGQRDKYISRSSIELSEKKYPGLKCVVLEDGKHFIQQTRPDDVNKLMREFLQK